MLLLLHCKERAIPSVAARAALGLAEHYDLAGWSDIDIGIGSMSDQAFQAALLYVYSNTIQFRSPVPIMLV